MGAFVSTHPWMAFFLGLVALGTVGRIFGGPAVVHTTGAAGGAFGPVPLGNGVYHGLVRTPPGGWHARRKRHAFIG
jgi:hypothetical protein